MTSDEARQIIIDGMNYAAYRETDSSLHDSDKNRLFGSEHYKLGRPVSFPPWRRFSWKAITVYCEKNILPSTVDSSVLGSKDRIVKLMSRVMCLALLLPWAVALPGQSSSFVVITPQSATLVAGESRSFRLVDQNGQMQRNVTWTVSDSDALQTNAGDEVTVTAKQVGDFRISAQSKNGSAEATVKVMEGQLPVGTKIWSSRTAPGCKSIQLIQAVPSANGPDMYDTSHCEDGDYITALTSDGMQLWRRRVGSTGAAPAAPDSKNPVVANPMNLGSTSVCDSISLGTDQQKIRDLLHQRNLSFSEDSSGERVWIVEESNRQCKLWFDDKSVLTKKRKIFVTE